MRTAILGVGLMLAATGSARAAELTVTIDGVRDASGHLRIGVCTRHEFLGERCAHNAIVPSRPGRNVVTLPVPPGTYAVAAYQDSTDAGHLRRGLFGIPKDGTGFSRDPSLRFGPPRFADCAFTIGTADGAVVLHLRYFD